MEKGKNKNIILLSTIAIALLIAITIAVSYAYWSITKTQQTTNVITTGDLSVEILNEQNAITLENAYPLSDDDGSDLTPFTFTVKNNGDTYTEYSVNLEVLVGSTLGSQYIACKLDDGAIRVLNTIEAGTKAETSSIESRKLVTGALESGQSATYNLRLWMDKSTPLSTDTQHKSFQAKIVVIAEAKTKPASP